MEDYRVVRTRNTQERARLYEQIDARSPLSPRQFVAGYIQHPVTRLYHVWLVTSGLELVCLSTHRKEANAESGVQTIKAVLSSQAIYDESKLTELFTRLEAESDEKPRPLPDDLVRQIGQAIQQSLVERTHVHSK